MSLSDAALLTVGFAFVSAIVLALKFFDEYHFQGTRWISLPAAAFAWVAIQVLFFIVVLVGSHLISN